MPERNISPPEPKGRMVGRFEMFDEVASGGFATIHLGRSADPAGGRSQLVAIKRLHPRFVEDDEIKQMFVDEARLAAQIEHDNVVPTLEFIEEAGELFLVMEYVDGVSLGHLLQAMAQRKQRIPLDIVLRIFTGTLRGLHGAHAATDEAGKPLGIVHRDVSPDNVLVGVDGHARLIDFGVARAIGRYQVKHEGGLQGKLHYLAPEHLSAAEVGPWSDVFSAAAVLWQCLTGQVLFAGSTLAELAPKIAGQPIDAPSVLVPGVPPKVDQVVMRGLERAPTDRWRSAAEMAEALEDASTMASPARAGKWVQKVAEERIARSADKASAVELTPTRPAEDADQEGRKRTTQASTGENSYQAATMQVVAMPSKRRRNGAGPSKRKGADPAAQERRVAVAPGADAPAPPSQRLRTDGGPVAAEASQPELAAPLSSGAAPSAPGPPPAPSTPQVAAGPSQPGLAPPPASESSSPELPITPPGAASTPGRPSVPEVGPSPVAAASSPSQPNVGVASAVLDEATPMPAADRLDGHDEGPPTVRGRSKLPLALGVVALVVVGIGGVSLMRSGASGADGDDGPSRAVADGAGETATAAVEAELAAEPEPVEETSEPAEPEAVAATAEPTAEPETSEPPSPSPRSAPVARPGPPAAPAEPGPADPYAESKPPPPPPSRPPSRPVSKPKPAGEESLFGRK